jgi:hypothetical protein
MEILFIHFYYLIIIYIILFLIYSKIKPDNQYKISDLEITIFKNNINCLKSLYISNRDVDANIALKDLVKYYNKLIETDQLSDVESKQLNDKFLELKNLLLSLNNYRGMQAEIIEKQIKDEL